MKKILVILVLSLLFFSNSNAEFIELKKCHLASYSNFLEQHSKELGVNYLDYTITINLDTNQITETIIKDKKSLEEWNKYLENQYGAELSRVKEPRISQRIYNITSYSSGLISGEYFKDRGLLLDEKKIFIDLEHMKFDRIYTMSFTNKYLDGSKAGNIVTQIDRQFKCEDSTSQFDEETETSSGSAFFINSKGNLITNNHVVDGCKNLSINYFGKEIETNLIAKDKNLDLALLKADISPKSYINFSSYKPKKLQKIYVAGYPFGKGLSDDLKISSGIISSLKGFEDNSNELQIDAAINSGNSGGPIVGEGGELSAVAVSGLDKEMSEGINFGIKSSAVVNFLGANDLEPSKIKKLKISEDNLLKLLEESTLFIKCEY